MTIFLLGLMGSGKTWSGTRLAERLNLPFVDLDEDIEQGEGAAIAEIFERSGEAGFRLLEREYLHRLAGLAAAVVATGGGTPCFFDNLDWMNKHGTTVYLKTPVALLYSRLLTAREARPLLREIPPSQLEAYLKDLLQRREPFYQKAQITVEQTAGTDFLALLEAKIRNNA